MSKIPTQRLLTSRQSIAGALVLRIVCSTRIMDFLWKGKWSGVEISDSKNRLLDRRECDNRRCQKKDLATCVLRHLQVVKPYIITSRGIVESNTIARSATNPSALIPAWRCTPLFMPGRNHTSVQSVTSRLDRKAFWVDTPSFTVEKRYTHATSVTFHATKLPPSKRILRSTMVTEYTIALNVNTKQRNQGTWQITRKRTLVKSHRDAQYASILASQLVHWRITWWGSIQERSRSNVTNATMLALLLVVCKATWEHTLWRGYSSATNARKLTNRRPISEDILGLTRIQIRYRISPQKYLLAYNLYHTIWVTF